MADQYIDEDYVRARLGGGFVDGLDDVGSISLTSIIESATALVQAYYRNNYDASAPSTTTDETMKLATMAGVRQMLCSIPEASIEMPDNWSTHPERLALVGIADGTAILAGAPNTTQGVGGSVWTSSDSTVTGSVPQRTSRSELSGY